MVDATGSSALFYSPRYVTIDPTGVYALVADTSNNRIRSILIASGSVTTLAGSSSSGNADGIGTFSSFNSPRGIVIDPRGTFVLVADVTNHRIRSIVISSGMCM